MLNFKAHVDLRVLSEKMAVGSFTIVAMISNHGRVTASMSCPSDVFSPGTITICRSMVARGILVTLSSASAPESVNTPDSTMILKERATEPHFGHGSRSSCFALGDSSMMVPQLAQEVMPAMPESYHGRGDAPRGKFDRNLFDPILIVVRAISPRAGRFLYRRVTCGVEARGFGPPLISPAPFLQSQPSSFPSLMA